MAYDAPINSYSDTTPHKREISDVVDILDPSEMPVVDQLGGLDGASGKFRFTNGKSTKVEWLEDNLPPLASTMGASVSSGGATITVADASLLQPGFVILVDSEYMWVATVNTTANTATVTRNFGGTQASHASTDTITIVSQARLEGDDSDALGFTDISAPYNYTQIFHQEVEVTGTMQEVAQWGISDEMQYQVNKALPHLGRLINLNAYHGQRKVGSATTPRSAGGFTTFITDNTAAYSATAATLKTNTETVLRNIYEDGGMGPWLIFVSPTVMGVYGNIYHSSGWLQVERQNTTVGMVTKDIITPYGSATLVMDRHATASKAFIVDAKNAGYKTFRPFFWEPLAKDGDTDKVEVIGEFTFCVKQDKSHGLLT